MAKKLTKKAAYELVKNDYKMFYRPMPAEFKELFPVMSVQVLEEMGLHCTLNHTGKMIGMQSISTTCKCNEHCVKRIAKAYSDLDIEITDMQSARAALKKYLEEYPLAENVCICAMCFSDSQQDMQKTMQIPLKRNYEILNNGIIHSDWLPALNCLYFRGESFGDFASANAAANVMNIARKNPLVNVTTWTKNLIYFDQAVKAGYNKPDNFKIIYSSPLINKVVKIPQKYRYLVNAVFTVFTEKYAALHNITINCGARGLFGFIYRAIRGAFMLVYVDRLIDKFTD